MTLNSQYQPASQELPSVPTPRRRAQTQGQSVIRPFRHTSNDVKLPPTRRGWFECLWCKIAIFLLTLLLFYDTANCVDHALCCMLTFLTITLERLAQISSTFHTECTCLCSFDWYIAWHETLRSMFWPFLGRLLSYARFTLADPMPRLCPDAVGSANVNGLPTRNRPSGPHREAIGRSSGNIKHVYDMTPDRIHGSVQSAPFICGQ